VGKGRLNIFLSIFAVEKLISRHIFNSRRKMKKSILKITSSLFAALLFSSAALAQNAPAFDKGDNTIGISIGVGASRHASVYGYGNKFSYVDLPAFALTYDHGFFGDVGPGTIGIGGIVAYQYSYLSKYGNYDASWTNFIIGARGTYHLTILKDKNNHFDPYAGVLIGLRIHSYSNTQYDYYDDPYDTGGVNPAGGVFVGAKYNFTKAFGAFAEVGYDISIIRIGLNFNF
jgi:hypothetical protein